MSERRLLLDAMLGRPVPYLRICGYDAAYALDREVTDDDELLAWAREENRTVVTRDREVGQRAPDAVVLSAREIDDQLRALVERGFELRPTEEPERCGKCNGQLAAVDASEPTPAYAPAPSAERVWRCRDCGQHFWKGSHWDDVRECLATVRAEAADDGN